MESQFTDSNILATQLALRSTASAPECWIESGLPCPPGVYVGSEDRNSSPDTCAGSTVSAAWPLHASLIFKGSFILYSPLLAILFLALSFFIIGKFYVFFALLPSFLSLKSPCSSSPSFFHFNTFSSSSSFLIYFLYHIRFLFPPLPESIVKKKAYSRVSWSISLFKVIAGILESCNFF